MKIQGSIDVGSVTISGTTLTSTNGTIFAGSQALATSGQLVSSGQILDTGTIRRTAVVENSGVLTFGSIFGTDNVSARYTLWQTNDPLLEAVVRWNGSSDVLVETSSPRVTVTSGSPSTLNFFLSGSVIAIQNLIGSGITLIARRDI